MDVRGQGGCYWHGDSAVGVGMAMTVGVGQGVVMHVVCEGRARGCGHGTMTSTVPFRRLQWQGIQNVMRSQRAVP